MINYQLFQYMPVPKYWGKWVNKPLFTFSGIFHQPKQKGWQKDQIRKGS